MLSFLYLTCALALPVAQAKLDKAKRTCSPATGTPPTNSQPARVATAWFAGFHAKEFPLENISWDKYTHQTYSFATTLSDPTQLNFTDTDAQLLPQFVKTAHEHPYVYNKDTNVMVSFDNAQSFAAKGEFIKSQNLLGFAMWEAGGDSNDILLDSIRGAVNFPTKQ